MFNVFAYINKSVPHRDQLISDAKAAVEEVIRKMDWIPKECKITRLQLTQVKPNEVLCKAYSPVGGQFEFTMMYTPEDGYGDNWYIVEHSVEDIARMYDNTIWCDLHN